MRGAGYHFIRKDENTGELSFARPFKSYPRFHFYLKENEKTNEVFCNLHFDQKKPIYKGAPAHSADYEGEVVEGEAERVKQILEK